MSDPEPSIDDLVFEYLEAYERSEADAVACLARLKESSSDGGEALESAIRRLTETGLLDPDAAADRTIGPYTIVRRLARGGMGEVFVARPTDGNGDEVAIKLLRRDLESDPSSRERFRREVEVVRRLRHPSIASLLDAGEHDGLPYLVFERVDGVTLENAIRAASERAGSGREGRDMTLAFDANAGDVELYAGDWAVAAARIGREVARALAHAHARGVVHRDVKPSNVMITPAGRVVLLDFGLAALGDAERMTRSGHRVGSLPFMAPEVVRGEDGATPSADVYSLGVTLFELATLRSPFEARDPDRLAVEILVGPGRSAHRVDADVPAELDRCIACAMETTPVRRYATAEALASDLTEFLEGRPVRARSASWPRLAVRWSRRHPVRASAVFAALFVVLAGPLLYAFAEAKHSGEVERVNTQLASALAQESAAKDDALDAAESALQAVNDQLRWFATTGLQHVPGATPVRRELVERGFEILDRLPDDPRIADSKAWARGSLFAARAAVRTAEGDDDGAMDDYLAQEEILRDLLSRSPDDARLTYELGALVGQRGNRLWNVGRNEPAIELLGEADELLATSIALGWDGPRTSATVLQVRANHASALYKASEYDAALELADRAESEYEPFRGESSAFVEQRVGAVASDALCQLARVRALVWMEFGELDAATEECERCIDFAESTLRRIPTHRIARRRIASSNETLADVAAHRGDLAAMESSLDAALARRRELVRDFPESQVDQVRLFQSLSRLAEVVAARGRWDEAFGLRRECVETWRAAGDGPSARGCLAAALQGEAATLLDASSADPSLLDECEAVATEAVELADADGVVLPDDDLHWLTCYTRCLARARLGDVPGARADAERVTELCADRREARPRRYAADAWSEVLGALIADGAAEDERARAEALVLDHLDASITAGYADRGELETNPALAPLREDPRFVALLGRIGGR